MLEISNLADVRGAIWHMDPSDVNVSLLDGEDGRIVIERSDIDEVAIHFMVGDDDQAVSSIYTTAHGALVLAGLLQVSAHGAFALAPPRTQETPEEG